MHQDIPAWIELLQFILASLAILGATVAVGTLLAWGLFWSLADLQPEPITPANAAHPTGGWRWLYPVAFVLAVLASMAYPMGFAP